MPAADFGSEKVAVRVVSSAEVKSRRTISEPALSKAKTESDVRAFSHVSAVAAESKNARVPESSASVMQTCEPSVSTGVGTIVSISLSQAVSSAAAIATAVKMIFLMILKDLNK